MPDEYVGLQQFDYENAPFSIATSGVQFWDNADVCVKVKAKRGYRMLRLNAKTGKWKPVEDNYIVVRLQKVEEDNDSASH